MSSADENEGISVDTMAMSTGEQGSAQNRLVSFDEVRYTCIEESVPRAPTHVAMRNGISSRASGLAWSNSVPCCAHAASLIAGRCLLMQRTTLILSLPFSRVHCMTRARSSLARARIHAHTCRTATFACSSCCSRPSPARRPSGTPG